jgi:hypothetical protein
MNDTLRKKISYCCLSPLFAFFLLASPLYAYDLPRLKSNEELAQSLWTDHTSHFEKLFALTPVDSFLEFGVGEGSYFFLKHCDHVRSVELLAKKNSESNERYYNACIDLFKNFPHWKPSIYRCSDLISEAVIVAETGKNPATVDNRYMQEINALCDQIFSEGHYDVAFVDPGITIRGSIVQALFGRVNIIAAHDTSFHGNIYGWSWIPEHPDYVKIVFRQGSGTSFWIHKDFPDLINELKRLVP